ncbi:MAG: N-acetyltransferase [Deltaproteobacteria bacterium]|nr:N-acetyltransferase [Deltaproteobacteria bacterium]RKX59461.1 MAG: N-acetyltransferase [Thermodesulfobacteriota bacterium]MBW1946585.1 N-acetyltransferase [Deltaproteobacteria bacterium]MBW1966805.1 N-acetyltransferase [Deltaproteobacteria bacterium]MBW2097935.1 N-acetyltransferase [Deltaproteobacteria bacterium]
MIRKAKISDARSIHVLVTHFADQGLLLPRSLSEIYDHLRDYTVMEASDNNIVGCVALNICWEDLAEVKSLAVREDYQEQGIGRRLVEHCLSEAIALGVYRVFTLTYQPKFFEKLGFILVDKSLLPHKIWADCIRCPKFPDCDEIALLVEL